jgi:hypothetical protein
VNALRLRAVRDKIEKTTLIPGMLPVYKLALVEAIPESDDYPAWLNRLIDPAVSDSDIGAMAREMVCRYLEEVAAQRGEEIES